MRDYEVIVYMTAAPSTGIAPAFHRYLFRYCVEAHTRTTLAAQTWRESLDERLIDHATGADLDGYVWGVKWQSLYPGGSVVSDSPRAEAWRTELGIDFHEVRLPANGHELSLVFSELAVSELGPGYRPWQLEL